MSVPEWARGRIGRRRAGFALPMVLVFALVSGVMTAVLLERLAAQRLTSERQVQSYRDRHFERGVREVISQWTDSLVGQPIANFTMPDGHALDIELADGGFVSVYLFDGQGPILTDPQGLSTEDRALLEAWLRSLGELTGWSPPEGSTRPVGPMPVSARTAPAEVLEAAALAVGSRDARRFVDSLLSARADGELTEAELETAKNLANLDPERRGQLTRMVVLNGTLIAAVIDVYGPESGAPVVRYGARFDTMSSAAPGGLLQSLGKFLSWEQLPLREGGGE